MCPEVSIPRTSRRTLTHAGADYHLLVAWPEAPPPPSGYAVAYLLDAHVAFMTMVESERARSPREEATGVPPTVIVGLALTEGSAARARRTWDFTRAGLELPDFERRAGTAPPATGGAEAFLDWVSGTIMPAVEAELPIDHRRRLLFGHSLGGLFAIETMFSQPERFQAIVAASPSIWWDAPGVLERATRFASTSPTP